MFVLPLNFKNYKQGKLKYKKGGCLEAEPNTKLTLLNIYLG